MGSRLAEGISRLGPARPTLAADEIPLEEFVGPVARLTLTDKRIIVSRRGHKTFAYEDLEVVTGGWFTLNARWAGLENAHTLYGCYIQTADDSESLFVLRASEAAAMIEARSPARRI